MKHLGMIDVTEKVATKRIAKAHAFVKLDKELLEMIKNNKVPKGNILEIARIAGVTGGKKTSDLIPYCHNIQIGKIGVDFKLDNSGVHIYSMAKTTDKTGIEMEAMVACSLAALTIYDMLKMFNKKIEISQVWLTEKDGGKDGIFKR